MQLCNFFNTNLAVYTQEVIGQRSPCVSVFAAAKHLHAPKPLSFTENAEHTEAHHTVTCEVVHPAPVMQLTHDGINPWIACPALLPCMHAVSETTQVFPESLHHMHVQSSPGQAQRHLHQSSGQEACAEGMSLVAGSQGIITPLSHTPFA